jgi:hypothetical protein
MGRNGWKVSSTNVHLIHRSGDRVSVFGLHPSGGTSKSQILSLDPQTLQGLDVWPLALQLALSDFRPFVLMAFIQFRPSR